MKGNLLFILFKDKTVKLNKAWFDNYIKIANYNVPKLSQATKKQVQTKPIQYEINII